MGLQQGYRLVPLITTLPPRRRPLRGPSLFLGIKHAHSIRIVLLGGFMRLGNYLGLLVLSLISAPTFAADYEFSFIRPGTSWSVGSTTKFQSAAEACSVGAQSYVHPQGTHVYDSHTLSATSNPASFACTVKIRRLSDGNISTFNGSVTRKGDSCPGGAEYDPQLGKCDVPVDLCKDKAGLEAPFSKAGSAPDAFMSISSNGYGIPQRQGCKDGCAVEIIDLRCKTFTAGPYLCRGQMGYTGQQCSTTGTGSEIAEDVSDSVDPETVKEEKPCVYTADGDKQVCESKKSEENTGESCGEVNGVRTCIPKAPDKNGIDIRTEATTKTNPDGSTTTTKTDTATSTTCKGIKNCTTTTTTVTTTTTKNPNGQTTGSNSTCTGPLCPNKSSNPDADGDGFGDCVGGNCVVGGGGGQSGSPVGAQDWFTPGEETFGSVLTDFSQKVQLLPVTVQTTKFLTFNASGSCPRWSVSAWVFDFDFDQFCTGDIPWSAIAAVIIAAASFLAFRIALL